MRLNTYIFNNDINSKIKHKEGAEIGEDVIIGITVTRCKQLLKNYGGSAYTQHIDRDGGVFETSPIELNKNNSTFKYNQHL